MLMEMFLDHNSMGKHRRELLQSAIEDVGARPEAAHRIKEFVI